MSFKNGNMRRRTLKNPGERPSAKSRALRMLARRDHSELEIKKKLVELEYETEEIIATIQWMRDGQWIKPDKELAEILARMLHNRGKAKSYINNYLKIKGLPPVESDFDNEVQKALEIAQKLVKKSVNLDRETLGKLGRKLVSRGFSNEVVRKVIYEKLRNSKPVY